MKQDGICDAAVVLIEILWNVKIEEQPKQPTVAEGINRNIVECKVKKTGTYQPGGAVLIETLWNVKRGADKKRQSTRKRINRNIVECKGVLTAFRL